MYYLRTGSSLRFQTRADVSLPATSLVGQCLGIQLVQSRFYCCSTTISPQLLVHVPLTFGLLEQTRASLDQLREHLPDGAYDRLELRWGEIA